MLRYDIDWYLAFKGSIPNSLVCKITNTLSLTPDHCVKYDNADITYRIHRSLDICLPIILTKALGYKIDTFRDCAVDKFVILISS